MFASVRACLLGAGLTGDEDWRCDGGGSSDPLALDSSSAVEVDDSLGLTSALFGPVQVDDVSATASFGESFHLRKRLRFLYRRPI